MPELMQQEQTNLSSIVWNIEIPHSYFENISTKKANTDTTVGVADWQSIQGSNLEFAGERVLFDLLGL